MTGSMTSRRIRRSSWWGLLGLAATIAGMAPLLAQPSGATAPPAWVDASDRDAARAWFVALADAQFYRTTADVADCAGLVRHALREAVRPHTAEWTRRADFPYPVSLPELRHPPRVDGDHLPLFRLTSSAPHRFGEFADADTIVRLNTRPIGRAASRARPGDLLYFYQPTQHEPHHVMVFVGRSLFEAEGDDWVVYHTGPLDAAPFGGEVRKVRLSDLLRHPSDRWRPLEANTRFVGVFRLELL